MKTVSCRRRDLGKEIIIRDSVIEERIPNSVREATTFEELFDALCDFKVDLESNTVIDKVTVTMDVPDVPTGDDEEVMVDLMIKAKNGFRSNLLVDSPKGHQDLCVGFQEAYFNISKHLDYIVSQYKYDIIRGNRLFQVAYSHPKCFFGLPFSIAYQNTFQNLLKESSVNLSSDSITCEIASRGRHAFLNVQCSWRNLSPIGDLDEERILKTRCSSSMLKECRPSLRTGITVGYRNNTCDSEQQPTEGQRSFTALTWNGFVGDVHSLKLEHTFEKHIPIIPVIADEPGLIFHIGTNLGLIHNFGHRTTRYVDRFFIDKCQVHGYGTRDFGPKSSSEDGGRKEGDVLGGDRFATLSAGISLPVVVSDEFTFDMRAKLFYEIGNVWNRNQRISDIWNSSMSSWGIGLSVPMMSSSLLEICYLFKQKRFGFSFSMSFSVCRKNDLFYLAIPRWVVQEKSVLQGMNTQLPPELINAVLAKSEELPEGTPVVKGYDFDNGLDLTKLLESYATMGFQATNMSAAIDEINRMLYWRLSDDTPLPNEPDEWSDPEFRKKTKCTIFFSYTSNMMSCGMREIIHYLVKHHLVDVIVTTCGGVEEDFIKCMSKFYIGKFDLDGRDLRLKGINRTGNLLVPNDDYCDFEDWMMPILDYMLEKQKKEGMIWTPSKMIHLLGERINNEDSVYYWAAKNNIPVFCPAITDGSIGDMLFFHSYMNPGLVIDLVQDIIAINTIAKHAPKSGQIIIGGGVVKHHVCNANLMRNGADFSVYINTAQEFDGSDAGARPEEAISWGKIRINAHPVKVYAEATLVFPLIVAMTFVKYVEKGMTH